MRSPPLLSFQIKSKKKTAQNYLECAYHFHQQSEPLRSTGCICYSPLKRSAKDSGLAKKKKKKKPIHGPRERGRGRGPKVAGQKVVERVTASSPPPRRPSRTKKANAWQCAAPFGVEVGSDGVIRRKKMGNLLLRSIVMQPGAALR